MTRVTITLPDGSVASYAGHPSEVYSFIFCERTGRVISDDDKQLHVWDAGSGEMIAVYKDIKSHYHYVSADGRWLVNGYIQDYGNSQDEILSIYYIGSKGAVSAPDQYAILSSSICDGIESWFSEDCCEFWTDGELDPDDTNKRQQYRLSQKDGLVSLELIGTHKPGKSFGEMEGVNSLLPVSLPT